MKIVNPPLPPFSKGGLGGIWILKVGYFLMTDVGNLAVNDVLSQKTVYLDCHSGLDPESSLFNPAKGGTGVYPVLDTERE